MSTSIGSLALPKSPDLKKAVASFGVVIPAAGTAQPVNPPALVNAATIWNPSLKWLRGTVVFAAGQTNDGGTAPTTVFLVPPASTYNLEFESDSGVAGDIPAIESITFVAIAPPTATAEASTYTALASGADAVFAVNFVQK